LKSFNYREELGSAREAERTYLPTDLAPFCNLFTGFPDLASSRHGFSIAAEGALPIVDFSNCREHRLVYPKV
jgi:hypothetical protein